MIENIAKQDCLQFLANHYVGYLGYLQDSKPYVVPITYFFDGNNTIVGYTNRGQKISAMRQNKAVSLLVSDTVSVYNWKSVLAQGDFNELSGIAAKQSLHQFSEGIKTLILKKEERNLHCISEFSAKIFKEELPIVFTIVVNYITGKRRQFT